MGSQIDRVKCWQGEAIYIDEKLVLELDEIRASDVIPLMLHRSFDSFTTYRASGKWLDEIGGDFPQSLREVVEENGKTIAENWEQS
jgi:hypothetical protein